MNYKKIQKELLSGKSLPLCSDEAIKYVKEPIGSAIIKSRGRPKLENPSHWSDRVKCKICGKEYTRSAITAHKKTQYHKIYKRMDKKFRKILLDENEK